MWHKHWPVRTEATVNSPRNSKLLVGCRKCSGLNVSLNRLRFSWTFVGAETVKYRWHVIASSYSSHWRSVLGPLLSGEATSLSFQAQSIPSFWLCSFCSLPSSSLTSLQVTQNPTWVEGQMRVFFRKELQQKLKRSTTPSLRAKHRDPAWFFSLIKGYRSRGVLF